LSRISLALNIIQGVTLNDLRAELAEADANLRLSGNLYAHEVTPSEFISQALEVEEEQ
jgi:hypothetical protein